jgi:glutamyl-tRNA synthetase
LVGRSSNLPPAIDFKPIGNGKLSKRDGDKLAFLYFPLKETEEGISQVIERRDFPEAVVNFFGIISWNDETEKELYFGRITADLSRVHKAELNLTQKTNGSITIFNENKRRRYD